MYYKDDVFPHNEKSSKVRRRAQNTFEDAKTVKCSYVFFPFPIKLGI